ncbi:MAG: tetratricopeptide repeat protein [Nitrospirae bacterium]|nr:tetratricopeptide repeat protein [Nitrospirota bacterium]
MHSNKLDRLKEKIFSGTNPKLFIPLSDEYKSRGMTADAIHVLEKCIEKFPKYMSARVALGNLYIEKGCFIHAIEEFGEVANAIPNNVLSHRKLAELYAVIGETNNALLAYKTILSIKPSDEDAEAGIQKILNEMQPEGKTSQETAKEEQVCFDTPIAAADTSDESLGETDEIIQDDTITIDTAAAAEPYLLTDDDATSAQLDFSDEFELPLDTDLVDTGDGEETIELTLEPSTDDTITIDTAAAAEPYLLTDDDASSTQIDFSGEYELPPDTDLVDTGDGEETIELTVAPSTDDTITIDTPAAQFDEPVSEIEEAAPPSIFDPVHEYELPPDIDIDDIEDIEETLELTEEQSTDEIITIDAMAEAAAVNDFGIEEAAPQGQEYELDIPAIIDTEDIEETPELTVEPSTDETTPEDKIAAAVDEPDFRTEEDEAPAQFNPMADYELPFDIAKVLGLDDGEGTVVLNAAPLTDEIIPIVTIEITETEPDFEINETAPPPPFNPVDEYSTPSEMDIVDGIDNGHVTAELTPKPIASVIVSIDALAATMAVPDFGFVAAAPPNPVEEHKTPPDIDGDNGGAATELNSEPSSSIIVSTLAATMAAPDFGFVAAAPPNPVEEYKIPPAIDGDNGGVVTDLDAQPLIDEITPDEISHIDTGNDAAAATEPDFEIVEAAPHFNPVEEYYMPPDIDSDNGGSTTDLNSVPLIIDEITTDEISNIDTGNDAAAATEPDFGIVEAAPHFNPAEEYSMPPDIDSDNGGSTTDLNAIQIIDAISHIETGNGAAAATEPDFGIVEAAPHFNPVEEYHIPPDIESGSVTTELTAVPIIDEITTDEISHFDTISDAAAVTIPDFEIVEASPHFNPVEEYHIPPDIDSGSVTTELTAEPMIDEITTEEISHIDTGNDAAAATEPDLGIVEAAPHFNPVEEYHIPPDIDSGSVTTELTAEPIIDEITTDEISHIDTGNDAAAEAEPYLGIVEASPHFNPVEEYHIPPDIDSGSVTTELTAEPMIDEITTEEISHIDTGNDAAAATEPDFEIVEAAPHFNPIEEYSMPPDIDSGSVTTELIAEPLIDEITTEEISHIDTGNYAAAETEPDFGIAKAAPHVNFDPVEKYYIPPDIFDIIGIDNSKETVELTVAPLTPETTMVKAAPHVNFNSVEKYYMPPDIFDVIDIDNSKETVELTVEPLTHEPTPINTTEEIAAEPYFRADSGAPPFIYNRMNAYELPPDIVIGDEILTAKPLAVEATPIDTTEEIAAEPYSRANSGAPPFIYNRMNAYELPPDIVIGDEILTAKPLAVEATPIDTINDIMSGMRTETEHAFGIEEATPPAHSNPADEYELPPDIDIDDTQLREELSDGGIDTDDTPVTTETEHAFGIEETTSPTQGPMDEYELPAEIAGYGEDTVIEGTIELKEEQLTDEIQHTIHSEITRHEPDSEPLAEMLPEREDAGTEIAAAAPLPSDEDKADKPFSLQTKTIKNMISKRVEGKVKAETVDSSRVWLMQELDMIDSFIITEHYLAAIKAFQRLLERYPGDEEILKRIDDIRRIAKLMDRDDNTMIRKLRYIKDKLKERKE